MGLARNLSKFKPNSDGLVEASDLGFTLSSEALTKSIPLKSGKTLSAGRAVNINSSGEVGDYPVLNTLGTLVTNSTISYRVASTDGSRTLTYINEGALSSGNPFQVRGAAITSSSTTTGSAVNLSPGGGYNLSGYARAINETQFLLVYLTASTTDPNNYNTVNYYSRVATVDASGGVTLGSAVTWSVSNIWPNGGNECVIFPLPSGRFGVWAYSVDGATYQATYASSTFSISGTTVTRSADADMDFKSDYQTYLTSGNKLVGTLGTSFYYCNYDGTTTSSYGTSSFITDRRSGTSITGALLNANYGIVLYQVANNDVVLKTFSVNQTTGVPTLTTTKIFITSTFSVETAKILVVSSTDVIVSYRLGINTYAISIKLNSAGEVIGSGVPLIIDSTTTNINTITKTDVSNVMRFFYSGNSRNLNINTYDTPSWSSVGTTSTSQSSSLATITVGGICGGFSGLTAGSKYYVNEATYDGQVTTTAGNYLVGTAVSSTEILLG
jgi:hypothetical protein